jgi:hypothetical protein
MGSDQDFEAFLREWANERIWSSGDSLGTHALQQLRTFAKLTASNCG